MNLMISHLLSVSEVICAPLLTVNKIYGKVQTAGDKGGFCFFFLQL